MRLIDLLNISETSSAGSTSSGNIATSVTPFLSADPDGDYGIYERPKKKNTKENVPIIIKR